MPSMSTLCILLASLLLGACKHAPLSERELSGHVDTAAIVYGPYTVIKLPITKGVPIANPIQLTAGPGGWLYAANQTGEVYALRDLDGDGLEETAVLFCHVGEDGLHSPAGLACRADTLYVGTREAIRAYVDREKDGRADTSWVFFDRIPESAHPYEWTSGLAFGPDGSLYAALTTDSWNAAPSPDPDKLRGSIIRIAPDGRTAEPVATGIRSVPSMTFTPDGDLLFIDNAGGGNPTEELNVLVKRGYYGHNKRKFAPDTGTVTRPVFDLGFDIAPSGIEFTRTSDGFAGHDGDLFVSYYGPGERWARGSISRLAIQKDANGHWSVEEHAVADLPKLSDIAFGPDGSLYAAHHGKADYWYNAVFDHQGHFYKIIHDPDVKPAQTLRPKPDKTFAADAVEAGKQLFAELSCLGCHQVDGTTELLGPNLKDIGRHLSREEILEEIVEPSKRIKASMIGMEIEKTDGTKLLGRVVGSDEQGLSLMLIGNQVVHVAREDIWKQSEYPKSLMYERLVSGLAPEKVDQLLDYILSLSR